MDPYSKLSSGDEEEPVASIVSFLGPVSSYTHQVLTLAQFDRPAWSIGLTDFDIAQAALGSFEADRYDYRPEITITGTTQRIGFYPAI
jgi:prephenate dehydratase